MSAKTCLVCRRPSVEILLDLGPQPVCNRFPKNESETELLHPMRFGACAECGVLQLADMVSPKELKPLCDWITYNEPEPHLDGLADRLRALPGVGPETVFGAVSSKDDSLLRRLEQRGIAKTWRLDTQQDLGEPAAGVGVETIQALLTPAKAREIAAKRGRADVIIARHIFEHAHDVAGFFSALAELAKPGGRIILEAPDCVRALAESDCSALWEEHSLYLTPESFRGVVEALGGRVELYEQHPYALENSMVLVAKSAGTPDLAPLKARAAESVSAARRYAAGIAEKGRELRAWADSVTAGGSKIAVFGAGHLGALWVNALGLQKKIAFFVDDNPNKKGLRMPGSRLPILGSESLQDPQVTWALMAFSPDAEEKVMAKNAAFAARGGRFASIFPGSKRALKAVQAA
jgi:hypothetical protein